MPNIFGVLAGTVGLENTATSCQDYCIWIFGLNIGSTFHACNPNIQFGQEY